MLKFFDLPEAARHIEILLKKQLEVQEDIRTATRASVSTQRSILETERLILATERNILEALTSGAFDSRVNIIPGPPRFYAKTALHNH